MARILLLLSALLLAGWCRAQDAASKVDAFISAFAQERRFMGSVLLARDGKVIFKKGYGMANLEHDVPNTPKNEVPPRLHHQTVHRYRYPAIGGTRKAEGGGSHLPVSLAVSRALAADHDSPPALPYFGYPEFH